ncbi:MAG: hypothetical protein CR997_13445 [Acidobacteria bacterium]|nr:MAG: hypothetical protein CR997_13445 [Acidobacteriota bacterium]
MIPGMPGNQITPDQAPPISLPFLFFATGIFWLIALGCYPLCHAGTLFFSTWLPITLGWTHFATLGFLASVMMGAFYQMTPVVAGKPVPFIKLGYFTFFLHFTGSILFVWGLSQYNLLILKAGLTAEGLATAAFLLPCLWAIFTAPIKHPSVSGMKLSILALFITVVLGMLLGAAHLGLPYSGLRALWIQAHLTFGGMGWIGMLLVSVSWQVVPMFYLTPYYNAKYMKFTLFVQSLLFLFLLSGLFVHATLGITWMSQAAALTLTLPILFIHPIYSLKLMRKRRRKVQDGSLLFWKLGLLSALCGFAFILLGLFHSSDKLNILTGWVLLFGWAGSIVHGMLYRIIPFLLWFHKFSSMVGIKRVPSMKSLLPEKTIKIALHCHTCALLFGVLAILYNKPLVNQTMGILIAVTGVCLLFNMASALLRTREALLKQDG